MAELRKKDAELDGVVLIDLWPRGNDFLLLQRPISTTDDTTDARKYTEVYDYLAVGKDGFKILRSNTEREAGLLPNYVKSFTGERSWTTRGNAEGNLRNVAQLVALKDKPRLQGLSITLLEQPKPEEIAKIIEINVSEAKKAKDAKEAKRLADEARKMADQNTEDARAKEEKAAEQRKKDEADKQAAEQAQSADNVLDMLGKL